ncbi:LysM peptidoglycan-binding domain-containing protein [Flammeovirga sp. SubArs3]|uniref:LysM peptidoglycan-binding domain-containing protein n=1 Tax=Flammeovirga sp. SubArs3 TaxID=2995316 RepID=UPI00248B8D3B|nr:LysM peptidoglycan-binding domain-containing protein [Flammeovirga sp. SubArs3]
MKKIYSISLLLSAGTLFSSFNSSELKLSNPNKDVMVVQQPHQTDNPYPIITNVHTKKVNGEEITLVDANAIPAFIAGPNQNLMLIATALGIDVKKIYKYNDMDAYDDLQEGHVYYLKAKKGKATVANHTVDEEKNLWEVSQRYGIKLSKLAKKNRMKSDEPLARGRVLFLQKTRPKSVPPKVIDLPPAEEPVVEEELAQIDSAAAITTGVAVISIPADSTANAVDPSSKTHTVQDGESLFTISHMYDVTMLELKEWNNIGDNLSLEEGQVLIVGKEGSSVATTAEAVSVPVAEETAVIEEITEQPAIDNAAYDIAPNSQMNARGKTITVGEASPAAANTAATVAATTTILTVANDAPAEAMPTAPEKYTVGKGEFYYAIARKHGVAATDLMAWNNNKELHPGDEIYVSNPNASNAVNSVASNPSINSTGNYSTHTLQHPVQKGETLESIAAQYDVTTEEIIQHNAVLKNQGDYHRLPMLLQIPQRQTQSNTVAEPVAYASTKPANDIYNQPAQVKAEPKKESVPATVTQQTAVTAPAVASTSSTANATTHTVQQGETLFAISRQYGVYHKDLIEWNNLPSNGALNAGQVLKLTAPESAITEESASASPQQIEEFHVVGSGDTLYSISRKYGVNVSQIKSLNNMSNNEIKVGQKLRVK